VTPVADFYVLLLLLVFCYSLSTFSIDDAGNGIITEFHFFHHTFIPEKPLPGLYTVIVGPERNFFSFLIVADPLTV
jgi:hypothetical protein